MQVDVAEPITSEALAGLARLLEQHRLLLLAEYGHDVEREREATLEAPGDLVDVAEVSADREAIFASVEGERSLLQEVEDALERLAEGTYGHCADCDATIPLARLRAVPWTRYCAEHQEALEAREARRAFGAHRFRFPGGADDEEGG